MIIIELLPATYVVNAANTWENKTVTFAGDTTGALDNDNDRSLDLTFWMDAGTNFTGGTFASSWGPSSPSNVRVYDTTGWLESTSPEWYITGVQLEVGETATPFEHPRSVGDELLRCQRYYYKANIGAYMFFSPYMNNTGGSNSRYTNHPISSSNESYSISRSRIFWKYLWHSF